MTKRCLYCYNELSDSEKDFHGKCSQKIFGNKFPPEIDFIENELEDKGLITLNKRKVLTGVQLKLSVEKETYDNKMDRLTLTGLSGGYILKPKSEKYPFMPEFEDLTMHLAEIADIKTVPHSLIRMKSQNLAYITKRIDRTENNEKIHMEDMCQLTERLTENKYSGSYEQIAKIIRKYTFRELDIINFFEIVLFSFLTGNADMHLKNFSLIYRSPKELELSPSYDLLPTRLLIKTDDEDVALMLNGRKKKINKNNFKEFAIKSGLTDKVFNNIFKKYHHMLNKWILFIKISFIPEESQQEFINIIENNLKRLDLI
jgi:serine/threonine-protein kinase HipA